MLQVLVIVVCLALTVVTAALTVRAVLSVIGVLRMGQPAVGRTDHPGRRLATMLKETVLHTRMLQWTWVGILHWFAFAAFLLLSTAVGSAYFQLFSASWTIPWLGKFFVYEWLAEGLGVLGTLGIIPLIVYRLTHMPKDQGRKTRFFGSTMWQAFFVEAMVLLESCAILFIRGAEYNLARAHGGEHAEHATAFHFPVAQFFGHLYPTGHDSISTLENIIYLIAPFKIVSALVWLLVISSNLTMGVAWHRFTAWFNIFFKRESLGRKTDGATTALGALKPLVSAGKVITLEDIDDLDEDAVLGVGKIQDFSWKGILDFTTCTECGRCQSQCPAWNTEKPLSPKLLMMGLREQAYAAAPHLKGDADSDVLTKPLVGKTDQDSSVGEGTDVLDWFYNPTPSEGDPGFVIDEDVLWSCTSCGACVQQCPVDIEHVDHIVDMRRYQVLVESNFPSELNGLFRGLENNGNPWNMSSKQRLSWTDGLDFDVKVVGEDIEDLDSVDWLFWVGCAGAYEDRAKKTTRAVAELLNIAGVSFGVLGNGETCTGDSARRAGNEFVFQGLAQQNVETFKEFKVKRAVTTCAHCFNTLKNEYKDFGIELEVVHHTQLLNTLVREGKLTPVKDGAGAHKRSITYHDPCYIGRHNGVYTPPRELLQILPGAEFVEMPRNSEKSFCCGAGGARMWMEEKIGSRININRTNEAVATGADQIAVGCPFCRVMLSDGLTAAQSSGQAREEVEVLDVAQMLLASVKGEQATKLAPGEGAAIAAAAAAPQASAVTEAPAAAPDDASSLFDTPAPAEPSSPPAGASGGSSLFDAPAPGDGGSASSGGSLFDTPAPEPEKPATDRAAEPGSGGSLFDVTPTEEKPASQTPAAGGSLFDIPAEAPDSSSTPAAPEKPSDPAAGLGVGGSLFDIPATTETQSGTSTAPEAKATPATGATSPQAPAAPAPAVDLNAGGSLFDIPATVPDTAPVERSAAPAQATPAVVHAETAADPSADESMGSVPGAPGADAAAAQVSATTPDAAPLAPAAGSSAGSEAADSSGAVSVPRTDIAIDEVGSLFDIEAPEGAVAVVPGSATSPAPAPATAAVATRPPESSTSSVIAEPAQSSEATEATEATPAASVPAFEPDTHEEPDPAAEMVEEGAPIATAGVPVPSAPAAVPAVGASSTTASVPHTDVKIDEVASLFDIPAPAGAVVTPVVAPAAIVASATSATSQEFGAGSEAEPAAESESESVEPDGPVSPTTGDVERAPEPAAEMVSEGDPNAQLDTIFEDAGATTTVTAAPAAPTVVIGESSGATHESRTDVDINAADSLFDL